MKSITIEELSQSLPPRVPTDSPSVSLSRLRVSDDENSPPFMNDYTHSGGLMGPGARVSHYTHFSEY